MIKRLPSIIKHKGPALLGIGGLLLLWQLICISGLVPRYMLPTPKAVVLALIEDRALLWEHSLVTLQEAMLGLLIGILIGYLFALLMDRFEGLYRAFYPLLILSQTVPTVAIAPLLVLWFGFEMTPKIILIVIATFFPITVGLLDGFRHADEDAIGLMRAMGASRGQIFWHLKAPSALPRFFSGLRIAAAYSVVGAVISEWLGGFAGLGVYMTRVRKAFAFDKMFAVIFLIAVLSLALMGVVALLERKCMPYRDKGDKNETL